MLRNYFTVALRNLRAHKGYAFINITGLAVGMACVILIAVIVQNERSFNRFHDHQDRLYRVNLRVADGDNVRHSISTMAPLAPEIEATQTSVEAVVRFKSMGQTLVQHNDQISYERQGYWADPAFFSMFSFPLMQGDPLGVLSQPQSIVLTEAMAVRYFGTTSALGQTLYLDRTQAFTVTGIAADPPANSDIRFDYLASFASVEATADWADQWGSQHLSTYVLLKEGQAAHALEAQSEALMGASGRQNLVERITLFLQPITDMHLRAPDGSGRLNLVLYLLMAVGGIILSIAAINYMNLATARASKRAREVGLRKVVGASRGQLVGQFLGESVVLALIAFPVAVGLVFAVLPSFEAFVFSITGRGFAWNVLQAPWLWGALIALTMGVGVISGSYPAFFLARFAPSVVLKGGNAVGTRGARLRRVLVVTQFAFTILFMTATAVISDQLDYLRQKDLGFDQEQVIAVHLSDAAVRERAKTFKQNLLQSPSIQSVSLAMSLPTRSGSQTSGGIPEGWASDERVRFHVFPADADYLRTFDLELVEGRTFSEDRGMDATGAFLINEMAARQIGWDTPLDKTINLGWRSGEVIGVVADFHFQALQNRIEPAIFYMAPDAYQLVTARVNPQDVAGTLAFMRTTWEAFAPDYPFEYSFADASTDRLFRLYDILGGFLLAFAAFAVFIACLGLFGVAAYTIERRTKEIGVRKVLGASVSGITVLLARDFLKLIVWAFAIAGPLTYFAMSGMLQSFAYRTELHLTTFMLVGALVTTIALLTVSYQSIRAALANPIKSLRYE